MEEALLSESSDEARTRFLVRPFADNDDGLVAMPPKPKSGSYLSVIMYIGYTRTRRTVEFETESF